MRLLLAVLLVTVAACQSSSSGSARWSHLQSTWALGELAGNALPATNTFTLEIDAQGNIAGHGPINRYLARGAAQEGGGWRVETVSQTRMSGAPADLDRELLYMRLLQRADSWRIEQGRLELLERKRVLLRFERVEGP
jgi:heat shock protein HslJ